MKTANATHYVNADWPTSWSTVHNANCVYVLRLKAKTRASYWSAHASLQAAFQYAERTGCKTAKGCGHCKPTHPRLKEVSN